MHKIEKSDSTMIPEIALKLSNIYILLFKIMTKLEKCLQAKCDGVTRWCDIYDFWNIILETKETRGSGTNELKVRVPQTSSHPSWDVLSSEVQCRLNMEGLY